MGGAAETCDNIGRCATQEESETTLEADVFANISVQRAGTQATLPADARYREYLDDTFDSQVVGGIFGNLSYGIVPDRLIWQVQDNFSQVDVDALAVESPDNRQNLNYFTTGPDLHFAVQVNRGMRLESIPFRMRGPAGPLRISGGRGGL